MNDRPKAELSKKCTDPRCRYLKERIALTHWHLKLTLPGQEGSDNAICSRAAGRMLAELPVTMAELIGADHSVESAKLLKEDILTLLAAEADMPDTSPTDSLMEFIVNSTLAPYRDVASTLGGLELITTLLFARTRHTRTAMPVRPTGYDVLMPETCTNGCHPAYLYKDGKQVAAGRVQNAREVRELVATWCETHPMQGFVRRALRTNMVTMTANHNAALDRLRRHK